VANANANMGMGMEMEMAAGNTFLFILWLALTKVFLQPKSIYIWLEFLCLGKNIDDEFRRQ